MAESKGKRKVATVMREFARGALRSGSKRGPKVEKSSQAKAIAMSEGRRVSRQSHVSRANARDTEKRASR